MAEDRGGSDLGTVIIAGAVGAAVGAAVALLLTSKAGDELRADLGEKAKTVAARVREKAEKTVQAGGCGTDEEPEAESAQA